MAQLMVLGTTSDAGKSTLVAGLCRALARRGQRVAPFKPQNMALNSAVTEDGGEIGRAQALQAQACMVAPHTDMNPILIKPNSDTGAQIIVQGRALTNMEAAQYHDYKSVAMDCVQQSFARLRQRYGDVVIEGAGSPAEINLRAGDIANMGFAESVDCPCILIADIDRGGVFAHIVGTLSLLSNSEQQRILGFVINRFRGDLALLQSGLDWLEKTTGKPVLGVLPYLKSFYLDAEDAIATQQVTIDEPKLRVVVPVLPHISNHTDFDSLRLHPEVQLIFADLAKPLPGCDLVILPGSKNVRDDLAALRRAGWEEQIQRHLRYGGKVFGLCGGYQMLGETIADPLGIEGCAGTSSGLGWLPMDTELAEGKTLTQKTGTLLWSAGQAPVSGYEIHHGQSAFKQPLAPLLRWSSGQLEGAVSADNAIAGSYCHGLFDQSLACQSLLAWCGLNSSERLGLAEYRDQQLERLADVVDQYFDWSRLNQQMQAHGYESLLR